jgi:hypothetical protein
MPTTPAGQADPTNPIASLHLPGADDCVGSFRGGQARLAYRPQLTLADLAGQRLIRHRVPEILEFIAQRAYPQMRLSISRVVT